MISVLIPTRGHVKELTATLDNLVDKCDSLDNFEVVLGIDEDDKEMVDFEYSKCKGRKIIFKERCSGVVGYFNGMRDFNTELAWVYSDNNRCETKGWDSKILNFYDKQDSKIWMLKTIDFIVEDLASDVGYVSRHPVNHSRICFFPVVTKKAVEALGFIYYPRFTFWGADTNLEAIMSLVNRVCDIDIITKTLHNNSPEKKALISLDLHKMVEEGIAKKEGDIVVIDNMAEKTKLEEAIKKEEE